MPISTLPASITPGQTTGEIADTLVVYNALKAIANDDHTVKPTAITEAVQDLVAAMIVAGANITKSYDDTAGTLTITATSTTDPEVVRDTMATALVAGTNVTITPNDAADTITISATPTDPELVRDTMGAALVAGSNITVTVNDAGDTITIAAPTGGLHDDRYVQKTGGVVTGDVTVPAPATANSVTPRTYVDEQVASVVQQPITAAPAFIQHNTTTGWPLRNTVTSDTTRMVIWKGPELSPPPIGSGYAINGVDVWFAGVA